jgi:cytochrome c-type biogenesis protein CcsB
MMTEIHYLLFQVLLVVTFLASAAYVVYFVSRKKRVRNIARWILAVSGILQTLYITSRYLLTGSVPVTSQHETIVFFAWASTWAYLSFRWRYTVKNFGVFVALLIFFLLALSAALPKEPQSLVPALQSWWLPVHAGVSLIAYGFLALAFLGGIMYLLQERELKNKRFGYFFSRLPSLDALDQLNSHCLTAGFLFLTLGIVTGTLWAHQAWGTYWQWDPKETWSLITWLIYLIQVHQRITVGWRGKRAAAMAILGFCSVIFTLWGVPLLLGGAHSYAR